MVFVNSHEWAGPFYENGQKKFVNKQTHRRKGLVGPVFGRYISNNVKLFPIAFVANIMDMNNEYE